MTPPETLAARVFKEECKALPDAITLYAEGGPRNQRPPRRGEDR